LIAHRKHQNDLLPSDRTTLPHYPSNDNSFCETRTWTYTWNGTAQLLTAQLPRTDVSSTTTYGYTGGTLTSITNALSQATNILTYTSGGLPKTVTDPNSVLTMLLPFENRRFCATTGVMSDDKILHLETALAHQDQQIQDLHDALHTQWREIEDLKKKVAQLLQKVKEVESGIPPDSAGQSIAEIAAAEKPPHY